LTVSFNIIPEDERTADLSLPAFGSPISKDDAKKLAVRISQWGIGNVAPNPLVGCVIVDKDHKFVSAGAHLLLGQHHAEINAINMAKDRHGISDLAGLTLYVTLEPCAHEGRTPSCAQRLALEKPSKVIYGIKDPNPKVSGKGAAIISAAGISCELDSTWSKDCLRAAEFFHWETVEKRPFVGLKSAISLDGAIARRGDQRTWITGERARALGHYLRLKYDAIAIGTWTLLHDNPGLTPRESAVSGRSPWRIVVDPNGRGLDAGQSKNLELLHTFNEKVVWILTKAATKQLQSKLAKYPNLTVISLDVNADGIVEPDDMLQELYKLGITSVLLEGGSGLYRPFIAKNKVNRYHLFQAAKLLGGSNKINFFEGFSTTFAEAPEDIEITALSPDWLTEFKGRISK
jgi:diaminohydroxyphosphoribosylaminopyrimidine deaminase/5-amino-6-(5-phosphoribosylamino)uracil reductase